MRIARIGLLSFTLTWASVSSVAACSCTDWPTLEEALAQSDAVFRGTVVSVSDVTVNDWPMKQVYFSVSGCWKGEIRSGALLYTEENEATCGYTFELGEEYLVYAFGDSEPFYTHLCWATRKTQHADDDLDGLGPPDCTVAVEDATWGTIKRLFRE